MTKPTAAFPEPYVSQSGSAPTPVQAAGLGKNPTQAELEAFFRAPPPPGRSRESRIVLDGEGYFSQDGEPFEHQKLAEAFHRWISRHPDDGRYILTNGLDWSYFTVQDAPYFVRSVRAEEGGVTMLLSDGSETPLEPAHLRIAESGALYSKVKEGVRGGPYEAKFTRHAQTALAPFLEEHDGKPALRLAGALHPLG